MWRGNNLNNHKTQRLKYMYIQLIYNKYTLIYNTFFLNELKMNNSEKKYINIPNDIDFLLDLCRNLIKLFRDSFPNNDIPIEREKIAKLRNIEKHLR